MIKNIYVISAKELKSFFSSPTAFIVIALFLVLSGYLFNGLLHSFFKAMSLSNLPDYNFTVNINRMLLSPFVLNLSFAITVMLPMLTMGSFAEEKKLSTFELLFTSPISSWEIVLGKFFGILSFYFVVLLITFSYSVYIGFYGEVELLPVLVGYLGLFLMGGTLIAIGVFISSTTESQVIAAVGTFVVFFSMWLVKSVSSAFGENWETFLLAISVVDKLSAFAKGIVETQHLVFYLSAIFFSLFLTKTTIESKRWRD